MMLVAAELAIKCSAIVLAGLAARALLRRRSAALRHRVLAAAVVVAMAAVPLSGILPAWEIGPASPDGAAATEAVSLDASPSGAAHVATVTPLPGDVAPESDGAGRLLAAAFIGWAGGAALAFALIAIAFARLARVTWTADRLRDGRWMRIAGEAAAACGVTRRVTLLQTDTPDVLGTWGWLRPRILLPAGASDWPDDRVRVVLCHELAHIRRGDWALQIGAELLRALWWCNPLFWIACTRLRRDSEQACDDAVLRAGIAPRDYAAHLLDLARDARVSSPMWMSALPMARASTLERRIVAMLNPDVNRQPPSPRAGWVAVTALLALALPIVAARTTAQTARPLTGSVYDVSGAVLPEVALTLEDTKGLKLETTSDASGRFEFPPVEPGRYVLQAGIAGFRPLRYELDLKVDRDWKRAVTLQVGEVKESIVISASRPAEPRAVAPIQAPTPVRVGGNLRPPRKLRDVKPVYPDAMREAGIEGLVLLEATIAGDGSVRAVRVLSSQAHPDLAVAAVDAVRQWQFEPTLLNGTPVDVTMAVTLEFKLE